MVKLSSQQLVRHFHFLNVSEERHSDVAAKGSNFLPIVERSKVGFPEDVKSLPHAQFACFGYWVYINIRCQYPNPIRS